MVQLITDGVTAVIGYFGSVITALISSTGDWYALAPLVGISIACSLVFMGISVVKRLIRGY